MDEKKKELTKSIRKLLAKEGLLISSIVLFQQNNRTTDYVLDGKWILRVSKNMLVEQIKLPRVQSVLLASHILKSGSFIIEDNTYYYVIIEYIHGCDMYKAIPNLTIEQSTNIGKGISDFISELHSIKGVAYDIGHYVATIPEYKGSWKEGHIKYVDALREGLSKMDFDNNSQSTISLSFNYIYDNINSLKYQSGPRLLHNDLHPKNIIVNEGELVGVIDWECSQYGEIDFELVHLIHWSLFPSDAGRSYNTLLRSVLRNIEIYLRIPDIEKRLTIYQLEHELNQILWNGKKVVFERVPRLNAWLDGQVEDLLKGI